MTPDIEQQLEQFCREICIHYNPDKPYTGDACKRCDVRAFVGWVVDESSLTTREDYRDLQADEEFHRHRDESISEPRSRFVTRETVAVVKEHDPIAGELLEKYIRAGEFIVIDDVAMVKPC